jgi:hypothetical protein
MAEGMLNGILGCAEEAAAVEGSDGCRRRGFRRSCRSHRISPDRKSAPGTRPFLVFRPLQEETARIAPGGDSKSRVVPEIVFRTTDGPDAEHSAEPLAPFERTNLSANAFIFGLCGADFNTLTPSAWINASH